jgi:serine/threonine-protein kinase RsbW
MKYHMLTISSHPNNISELEAHLQQWANLYKVHPDRYADILISLTEAVNNAIIHGNKYDENKKVSIDYMEVGEGMTFCVTDEGIGFNPGNVPDPTCDDNIECCGGRGVYIMKALADHISFKNQGRSVEMYFTLQKQHA